MNNNSTHPAQMRHPGGVLDWPREPGRGSRASVAVYFVDMIRERS
jgi:hypothetical protein